MSCSICTESCDDISIMGCGHTFHENCIMKWLEVNNNCPNCRKYHPISKEYIMNSYICACGSCTLYFTPSEINIWIDGDKTPLCPHCFVDCVFPFSDKYSLDEVYEFINKINIRSFDGVISLDNDIKIAYDIVVIVNKNILLTSFYKSKSKSFCEYIEDRQRFFLISSSHIK